MRSPARVLNFVFGERVHVEGTTRGLALGPQLASCHVCVWLHVDLDLLARAG